MSQQQTIQEDKKMGYWQTFKESWSQRAKWGDAGRNRQVLDFLPAALEVLERPPSPAGQWLGRTLMILFVIAVTWAWLGEVDIVAMAEGKIISSGRIKEIQPLEKGVIKAIYVSEGESVKAGQPLVELDQTRTTAE